MSALLPVHQDFIPLPFKAVAAERLGWMRAQCVAVLDKPRDLRGRPPWLHVWQILIDLDLQWSKLLRFVAFGTQNVDMRQALKSTNSSLFEQTHGEKQKVLQMVGEKKSLQKLQNPHSSWIQMQFKEAGGNINIIWVLVPLYKWRNNPKLELRHSCPKFTADYNEHQLLPVTSDDPGSHTPQWTKTRTQREHKENTKHAGPQHKHSEQIACPG